jgi:hypothetical protein
MKIVTTTINNSQQTVTFPPLYYYNYTPMLILMDKSDDSSKDGDVGNDDDRSWDDLESEFHQLVSVYISCTYLTRMTTQERLSGTMIALIGPSMYGNFAMRDVLQLSTEYQRRHLTTWSKS